MNTTQFAMVEELAFLIKDNLPSKHLVLSMEETLVNFLQDDTRSSSDGVLELEPMNPYDRLLLHRLADIFGFSHQSIGEGDTRHLILERCPETSVPSILVSDLLWQYDEYQSPMSHQLLKRKEASPVLKLEKPTFQFSLEEREAAYLAARERIFSVDEGKEKEPVKQKTREIPVVARRMIAHALGQRIISSNQALSLRSTEEYGEQNDQMNSQERKEHDTLSRLETYQETTIPAGQTENSCSKPKVSKVDSSASSHPERKKPQKLVDKTPTRVGISRTGRNEIGVQKDNLKEEHMGAAKRMFAHALGFHSAKDGIPSKSSETKQTNRVRFE